MYRKCNLFLLIDGLNILYIVFSLIEFTSKKRLKERRNVFIVNTYRIFIIFRYVFKIIAWNIVYIFNQNCTKSRNSSSFSNKGRKVLCVYSTKEILNIYYGTIFQIIWRLSFHPLYDINTFFNVYHYISNEIYFLVYY